MKKNEEDRIRNGRVRQMESGVKRYFMIDKVFFDSLFDLISHYQAGSSWIFF
jgi:hypothetical protein